MSTRGSLLVLVVERLLKGTFCCGMHSSGALPSSGDRAIKLVAQRKLVIDASDTPLESEAEQVAEQVMAMPRDSGLGNATPCVQRISARPSGQQDSALASLTQTLVSPGSPLESVLRRDMEQRFGYGFIDLIVLSLLPPAQLCEQIVGSGYGGFGK